VSVLLTLKSLLRAPNSVFNNTHFDVWQGVSERGVGWGIYVKNLARCLPQHKLFSKILIQNVPTFPKYVAKVISISCSGI
jgi:hypothetical protein